jgi:hypothetical protein
MIECDFCGAPFDPIAPGGAVPGAAGKPTAAMVRHSRQSLAKRSTCGRCSAGW